MKPSGIKRSHWLRYNLYFALEHFFGYANFTRFFGKKSARLTQKIKTECQKTQKETTLKLQELDPAFIENGQIKKIAKQLKEPVLLKGAAKDWGCTKKWNLDFFQEHFGDLEVHLVDTVGAVDPKNAQEFETLSLREYIDQLKKGSFKYLKFSNLMHDKMELQKDLNLDWLKKFELPGSIGRRFFSFIGGAGTITPLHNEFPPVVYVQVYGRKRWILYPSKERIFLDPRTERRHYFYTNANPEQLEEPEFPLIKYGQRYEVILEPGDVLWFPPFAWHYVENLTDSIGVAYKYNHIPAAFSSSKVLTSLYFMATKPNVFINYLSIKFGSKNVDTKPAIK